MARKLNNSKHRPFKKVDLFIVDGPTEKWYLEDYFKLHQPRNNYSFSPDFKGSWKKNILTIKDKLKDFEYIYWIVDMDVILKEETERKKGGKSPLGQFISEYKLLSKKKNVKIFVNNPCFEYWILLHFGFQVLTSIKCDDILPKLEKIKAIEGYAKTERFYKNHRITLVERLNESFSSAIINAKKIGEFDVNNPYKPVSEIYKLFGEVY
jgi:hypothetical protein